MLDVKEIRRLAEAAQGNSAWVCGYDEGLSFARFRDIERPTLELWNACIPSTVIQLLDESEEVKAQRDQAIHAYKRADEERKKLIEVLKAARKHEGCNQDLDAAIYGCQGIGEEAR